MESVLISARPKWCWKICHEIGKDENSKPIYEKRIEVRKTAPKKVPFKAYIYCSYGNDKENYMLGSRGKVIGEFICDEVDEYKLHEGLTKFNPMGFPSKIYAYLIFPDDYKAMCLSYKEVKTYGKGKTLYGWHISDLKIYGKPKELSEFRAYNFKSMNGTDVCGNYDCKYYQDSGSYMIPPSCAKNGCRITHPPQSWQYVEEKEMSAIERRTIEEFAQKIKDGVADYLYKTNFDGRKDNVVDMFELCEIVDNTVKEYENDN